MYSRQTGFKARSFVLAAAAAAMTTAAAAAMAAATAESDTKISKFIPPWRSFFTQRQGHSLAGPRLRSFALQRRARAGRGRLDTEGWGATKCV